MVSRVSLVNFEVGGANLQLPTRRHCVPRVDSQIHYDLLDLTLIRLHTAKLSIELHRHFNVLT